MINHKIETIYGMGHTYTLNTEVSTQKPAALHKRVHIKGTHCHTSQTKPAALQKVMIPTRCTLYSRTRH